MENRESFAYDPLRCNKTKLVKDLIDYDKLVDRLYTYMGSDWLAFMLNLWFRNSVGLGAFTGLPLAYDNDTDMIYHTKAISLQKADYDICGDRATIPPRPEWHQC